MIGKNLVIDKRQAKSIRNDHNDAFGLLALGRLRDICAASIDLSDGALWRARIDMATKALGARHCALGIAKGLKERTRWLKWVSQIGIQMTKQVPKPQPKTPQLGLTIEPTPPLPLYSD